MASGDREGGGPGRPRADAAAAEGKVAPEAEERPLEISRRGRIVVRSSSHPPGDAPPYSDAPPGSTLPEGRTKRDTPAERPRGRRAARAMSISAEDAVSPSQPPYSPGRGTTVLWAIIVALSAALAYSLLR